MMYNRTALGLLFFLFFSMLTMPVSAQARLYGKELQLERETPVSELLDHPDRYLGTRVRIRGMIVEVCARRGCWVNITGDRPFEKIQVKVRDGEIVFPMSASGRMAVVEGIVDELKLSREQLIRYRQHLAQENGEPFDPATVTEGEKIIRLIGIGAEIEE